MKKYYLYKAKPKKAKLKKDIKINTYIYNLELSPNHSYS